MKAKTFETGRFRASCHVIEKEFCQGFVMFAHGSTKEQATKNLLEKTKGYWHVAQDKIEYRDYSNT